MEIAILIFCGLCGAVSTFYLNNHLQLGGVMASAGISVLVGGFFYFFPDVLSNYYTRQIPLVIMGASFIGMATSRIIKQYWIIGLSGIIFSIIFIYTGSFFKGFGGGLGTTAAIALCASFILGKFDSTKKISGSK